ncbi:MAG: threonine ammonia-lyase [Candidatus Heimdallarchaeota archaeon]|nr:MAG: threonine ammonia-lyase [Candidatus Heimdallarchaeota archaeon]
MVELTIDDILDAQKTLEGNVKRTPMNHSTTFSKMTGCEVYLKHENLQRAGSFKVRGAFNKIAHLDEATMKNGVVAVSTGNHAQGVASAAAIFGINSTIVMPKGAPISKIEATKGYGGKVILYGDSFEEAFTKAKEIEETEHLTLIHAFDDLYVAAGQGTIGLEILDDLPDVDLVICPIGGGGLISGIATAIKSKKPECRVVGVQAKQMDAAFKSFKEKKLVQTGKGTTIADGIAIKRPSEFTFSIIKSKLDDVVVVDEEEIARAMLLLLERCKSVTEGAGAVALGALLNRDIAKKGEKVVLVVSGGNVDITILSKLITQGLIGSGRYRELKVLLEDKPGRLESLLKIITKMEANIIDVNVDRFSPDLPFNHVIVDLSLETKNLDHSMTLVEEIRKHFQIP